MEKEVQPLLLDGVRDSSWDCRYKHYPGLRFPFQHYKIGLRRFRVFRARGRFLRVQNPAPSLRFRFRGCRASSRFIILVTEHKRRNISIATAWFSRSLALRANWFDAVTLPKVRGNMQGDTRITRLDPPLATTLAALAGSTIKWHCCFDAA